MSLTRRQFLAAGALGTAGAAVAREASVLRGAEKPWNASPGRGLRKYRDGVPTVCTLCPACCAITAYRDGDRVAQVGPNPAAGSLSAVCARAYQSLESLYDPERVLRPLRRKGRRGEGRWEEISWGAAAGLLGEALSKGADKACVDLGRPDPLAGELLTALGVREIVEDDASRRWAALQAQKSLYGAALGRPDLSKARTILLLGTHPLDDSPDFAPFARDLVQAKARGASIVAVSSYEGATGSLATEWIPVRPGTEPLVALALVRVVLSQGWYDAAGLSRAIGTPVSAILQDLLRYSMETVEAVAGIRLPDLVRLGKRLAAEGPALCLVDGAGSREASPLEAAAAVLSSLSGSPEAAGVRLAHVPGFVPRVEPTGPRTHVVKDILAGNEQASVYLAYRSNPVYGVARSESARRAFADEERVGLLVAVDTQMTETAALADLVLPAATDLELWNLLGGYTPEGKAYALLQQPATRVPPEAALLRRPDAPAEALFDGPGGKPLGEARQLGDILLAVLDSLQHPARARFPDGNCGSFVRRLADSAPLSAQGGFRALARTGVWTSTDLEYPWAEKRGFPGRGGKIDVQGSLGHRMPPELRQLSGDTFALLILRQPELAVGYANSRWGREIRHRNPLLMNAAAARKMGLEAGDRVTVRTAVAEADAHVLPIQGIHPQAVALADDCGHWAGGAAATARADGPGGKPWWHEHGPGASVWALSPFASDELGAQAWKEIRVTVRKV